MEKDTEKVFTTQGLGTPESERVRSDEASSAGSSACDCNKMMVGGTNTREDEEVVDKDDSHGDKGRNKKRRSEFLEEWSQSEESETMQVEDIVDEVTGQLFDLINGAKLSKVMGGKIFKQFCRLKKVIEKKQEETVYLKGQLAEQRRIQQFKNKLEVPKQVSFAEAVKQNVPIVNRVGMRPIPYPEKVIIRGKEGDTVDLNDELKKIINPKEEGIQIKNVVKRGNCELVVILGNERSKETIMKNKEIVKRGWTVEERRGRRPRMILFGVDRQQETDTMMDEIWKQNFPEMKEEDFERQFELRFKTGKRESTDVNWVAEVSPKIRNMLRERGKIFLGWRSIRVADYVAVTRCYRCQLFGHIVAHCTSKSETCWHYGEEGHIQETCEKKNKDPICVNCKRLRLDYKHGYWERSCQAYKRAMEAEFRKIDYVG